MVLIKRHQRFARLHSTKVGPATNGGHKNSKKLQDRFPLWKLAINVGTFAIFNACYMIWGVSSLFLTSDKCFFVTHFNKMIRLLAFVHLSIMIRIIVDPMLAFFTDLPVRILCTENNSYFTFLPKSFRFAVKCYAFWAFRSI